LVAIQRSAPNATAVNQGWRHDLANVFYHQIARLAGGKIEREWDAHRAHMARQVLEIVRRDPGRRVLVVVNVRHCHHLRPALRQYPDIEVVPFEAL
jgi:hypothetical protein